ncbi:MAG: hypothetical protein JWR19_176 [Pedosphaera sp.]|nr:hypothetical protein [Pedosphaera sp.]
MFFKPNTTARILTLFLLGLIIPHQRATAAELPVNLGSAANFGVLAGSTVTSTGFTVVNGDLGLWPGSSISGFPPATVTGTKHIADPTAQAAQGDLTIAFNDAAGRSTAPVSVAGNLGGQTLAPGLYKSTDSLEISSGDLTLDGQGDPNAVFIFQMVSTFVTFSGRQVILIGGAQAANVFWQVGTSATIGTGSGMKGTILADQSISIQTGATLQGRALARIGGVTLQGNALTVTTPVGGPGSGPFVPSTNLFVSAISPITLNPQTGLFEQTVTLTNGSVNTVDAARLLIQVLPADVQVYNASGSISGTPFVQNNLALAPGTAVNFLIEYYRSSRQTIPQPAFVPQDGTALPAIGTGPVIQIDSNVQLTSGRFLLEFTATPGGHYAVQYSSNMTNWKTANPTITAPANRVQWYDDGPPKTDSQPTNGSRFYRIMVMP